jgi:hypothetical protein
MCPRILFLFLTSLLLSATGSGQFTVSPNHHYLRKNGQPFFWLGDTAWELFHRLTREEAGKYLTRRKQQGFTVIQAVALAELDGLHTPNAEGQLPLQDDDPAKPNEKYFELLDYVIDKAASLDMNIALLPTWGDKLFKNNWGTGPEIFTEANAAVYGNWIADRYKDRKNIIWILGGDRIPRGGADIAIWQAMALAIMRATGNRAIISYHGQPNETGSAAWFGSAGWFAFNIFQNGHCRDNDNYNRILNSWLSKPTRPVIDAEPIYEDHPVCFNVKDLGTSSAYDVRKYAYLDLFAGAFGHTYGCHDIWQFYDTGRTGINGPHLSWQDALELPGAVQMGKLKKLMTAYPLEDRVPDQSLIAENNYAPAERIQATRGKDYLFVYTASGKSFTLTMAMITGKEVRGYWFDPRNGTAQPLAAMANSGTRRFDPPSAGYGKDWVLILEDNNRKPAAL